MCIHNVPLLSALTDSEIEKVSEGVSSGTFKKGEFVFRQGEMANKLYIVCAGKIKIYKTMPDGREQILYILAEDDFIGAFNLLKADEFDFNAVALEPTTVSMLEKSSFDAIVLSNPEITLKIFEKAYERITRAESLVERLSSTNPDAKVIGLLLDLIENFGETTDEGILLTLTMNREEMGSYAGIARETMSRKLQLFQEMGLIKLVSSRKICIYDVHKLRALI